MKLVRFSTGTGASWGLVDEHAQEVIEAPAALRDTGREMVQVLVEMGRAALHGHFRDEALRRWPLHSLRHLPPVAAPCRILCVGLNYRAHVEEVHRELPPHPSVFLRAADTLVGHGGTVPRPVVSDCLDYEGELAVVVGRGGSRIEEASAMAHVAGYTCFNDISVRDWQKHSVTAGKNFADTAPCGPWLVDATSVPDPGAMEVLTRLNGREVQRGRVDSMVYSISRLVSYLSSIAPLRCGDIIATGTPAGVGSGRKPPLWMQPGDCVEVEVSSVGVLRNTIGAGC